MKKYKPRTRIELCELVRDESVYLGDIDTSLITDMSWLFHWSNRKDFSGINEWDTSNVTDMSYMFYGCVNFNQPVNFDTSKVTSMENMFFQCENFNQLLNFDTRKVENMKSMFEGCINFNQSLNFDTRNVTDMSKIFRDCKNFNQSLNFDTSNVVYINNMFDGCEKFDFINMIKNKDLMIKIAYNINRVQEYILKNNLIKKVANKYQPSNKYELKALAYIDGISLNDIDTSLITDMSGLFANSTRKDFNGINTWDTS
ncbi:BspA family leucine-rich repeat surface protein, partial [Campylobacter sp. RM9332]